MRLFSKTTMGRAVVGGSDDVIGHIALPFDSKLLNVWGQVSVMGQSEVDIRSYKAYGVRGYILNTADWDQAVDLDVMWDALVLKDRRISSTAATEELDFERASADTVSDYEIGLVKPEMLWSVKSPVEQIWKRDRLMGFANSPTGFDTVAPSFLPRDSFPVRVKKNYKVEYPSYCMFGCSNPDAAEESSTVPTVVNDEEWFMLGYLEYVLEQAWIQIVGLTETGAESPHAELMDFLERIVEPVPVLDTGIDFNTGGIDCMAQFTFEIQVPGKPQFGTVSGG